jgi:RNA polymerase sigma-70 factor (ECF subfamily)
MEIVSLDSGRTIGTTPISASSTDTDVHRVPSPEVNWVDLVAGVERGEDRSMAELYRIFGRGIRFFLCRQLGYQEVDDKVHDTFLIVVQAIQRGDLREPERLMGFVRTVVRRQVAGYIDKTVHSRREEVQFEVSGAIADHRSNPEQSLVFHQKVALMKSVLLELGEKDREVLTRFYLKEQTQEKICGDMDLSETQFRLLKSRAKARLAELGQAKLKRAKVFVAMSRSRD